MLPALDLLIRLQTVETRAAEARKRIADAPAEIAALDARLTAAQDSVAAARKAVADAQEARRTHDKDLASAQQRLSKYREQLMAVKTNAEYHAMQHQIEAAIAEVGKVEEQILVNMLETDEVNARVKAAEAAFKSEESAVAKERARIQTEASGESKSLQESEAERATIVPGLERGQLDLFERVLKGRQGIAVAQAINGICSICRVRLRPQVYNTILKNEAIVQCDHCQRILYFAGVHQRSAAGHAAVEAAQARQDEHERPTS
jgi:predicted  nucleic acid-binding Zn-ribbon protein